MTMRSARFPRAAVALLGLAALAACATESSTTAPRMNVDGLSMSADVLPTNEWFPTAGTVRVCNFFTPGSYTASATGPTLLGTDFTLANDQECVVVWQAEAGLVGTVNVTVTETPDAGSQPFRIAVIPTDVDSYDVPMPSNTVTVTVSATTGVSLWFKNETMENPPPPPPPTGNEGCTPGYWKQKQHFDSWPAPYTTGTAFSSVFSNAFPGKSLLQVVSTGSGGLDALGRHTVAALLNSASLGVDYGLTTQQVIDAFNAAYASGDYETQKNIFEALNEKGCPLN